MQHLLRNTLLAAACALAAAPPATAQTIASKLEIMGEPAMLQFTGLRMREQNGLIQVQAVVSNNDTKPQTAYYRVQWLDDAGFQVWDDEAWKPLMLHGAQKLTLQMVAPTTKARDFKIQFSASDNRSLSQSGANTNSP
ncbi:YcfL family protein [Herbaspirillum sp. LeCh32-8]|uniref:YcfL family protein n=1 Tax=Herbaspirillum sp. LeCh32-8 TaxID=2821356 RepID=UPI001AE413C8|nr:YcfL family protein [Herbaspirillum sp. LeCh32-8]MBP0597013.1 YcfL family protein [Herbaspirillum sp. LeCh32-8]